MTFRLVHARYDNETERAYVELRDDDGGGDEFVVTTISPITGCQSAPNRRLLKI